MGNNEEIDNAPFHQLPSGMDREIFVKLFGGIYEHSPWVAERSWDTGLTPEHDLVGGLHALMSEILCKASHEEKLTLIRAHPELTGKMDIGDELTASSRSEQISAGLDKCTPEEFERFQKLNAAYKNRFKYPFIMAVKNRSRAEILKAFERRLKNVPEEEFNTALKEVNQIALLRLRDLWGPSRIILPRGKRDKMHIGENKMGLEIARRIERLANFSETPNNLTRTYLTYQHKQVNDFILEWMQETGMDCWVDPVGNIVGRYEGRRPGLPALMLGSHLDTVRNAGKYDGILGVLSAVACVKELHEEKERLDFAIEVVGFSNEEGVRFQPALLGSRAVAGRLDPSLLDARDETDTTIAEALQDFGLDPKKIQTAARRREDILAYVELHIEQGPVLESEGIPLGVVTSIAGQTHLDIQMVGAAGHAGTVPMKIRKDALATAAEAILAVEKYCLETKDLVGTVGMMEVSPGTRNTIPGKVRFSVDIRAEQDRVRQQAVNDITTVIHDICRRRDVSTNIEKTHECSTCSCSSRLIEQISDAIVDEWAIVPSLSSGAGHDAMVMANLTDVGMLLVRCQGGISHHPDESVAIEDIDLAARVLLRFIKSFRREATGE